MGSSMQIPVSMAKVRDHWDGMRAPPVTSVETGWKKGKTLTSKQGR